jgi:hypothetical protein
MLSLHEYLNEHMISKTDAVHTQVPVSLFSALLFRHTRPKNYSQYPPNNKTCFDRVERCGYIRNQAKLQSHSSGEFCPSRNVVMFVQKAQNRTLDAFGDMTHFNVIRRVYVAVIIKQKSPTYHRNSSWSESNNEKKMLLMAKKFNN